MFKQDDSPPKDSVRYVLGIAFATAAVSTLGAKLVDWMVDEFKLQFGTKPSEKDKK